jgi:integrase
MIMLAYLPRLRASELVASRRDMIDLEQSAFHVTRRKNGRPSVHPLRGDGIRSLRRSHREQVPPEAT